MDVQSSMKDEKLLATRINNGSNVGCDMEIQSALFEQVFMEWWKMERNDQTKLWFFLELLQDCLEDRSYSESWLTILDPYLRREGAYRPAGGGLNRSVRTKQNPTPMEKQIRQYVDRFEAETVMVFLKNRFDKLELVEKQTRLLSLLRLCCSDLHLSSVARVVRSKLIDSEAERQNRSSVSNDNSRNATNSSEEARRLVKDRDGSRQSGVLPKDRSLIVRHFRDFAFFLPVEVTKKIFSFLDLPSVTACLSVSRNWKYLAQEVVREKWKKKGKMKKFGIDEESLTEKRKSEQTSSLYKPYNMVVVTNDLNPKRVIDFNEGVVAVTAPERNVVTLVGEPFYFGGDSSGGWNSTLSSFPLAHVGSVKCILLNVGKGFLVSSSYDATIRKWSLKTKKCLKIYTGHGDVVCCIHLRGDRLLSGSHDNSCRVWSLETGVCQQTFLHDSPVTGVSVHNVDFCLTATMSGFLRMFHLSSGNALKKLQAHTAPITCLKSNRVFAATSSSDKSVKVWSFRKDEVKGRKESTADERTNGSGRCVFVLEHPRVVQCLELKNKELITGCDDGRIRIWSVSTGLCSRILWGNRYGDPIVCLVFDAGRLLVSTESSVIMYEFEGDPKEAYNRKVATSKEVKSKPAEPRPERTPLRKKPQLTKASSLPHMEASIPGKSILKPTPSSAPLVRGSTGVRKSVTMSNRLVVEINRE